MFFNFTKPNRIKTDKLDLAIKIYLLQPDDQKQWHFIIYYSRKLFLIEQNYNIADKKLLIIVICFKEWHMCIKKAIKITIYTNYKNLLIFTIIKILNQR